jgi:LacI family transcriptional regulator
MARNVTLKDVAVTAEVSTMTVSNYVNGKFQFMSKDTRKKVERAIKRMGYRPHLAGRDLRLSKGLTIGLILLDESPTFLADPFNTYVVAGLSNYLSARKYCVLLQGVTPENFKHSSIIKNNRTDGICVIMSGNDTLRRAAMKTLVDLGHPLVLFQESARSASKDVCSIRQDDKDGGVQIATHLLERGVRSIVMLVPRLSWPALIAREQGIRQTIEKSGGTVTLAVVRSGDGGFSDTQQALTAAIASKKLPDAIVAGNDQMGIAAMKLVRERGVKVPDDVLITGFNAFDFRQYTDPILTSVRSPAYDMGARGGEEMLRRLNEGKFATREVVFPVQIKHGGST